MSVKPDPALLKDLKKFGLSDVNKCYQCGTCTATCPLSTTNNAFPRKLMKYVQLGLKDKLKASPEPWLCYYCGDCSEKCPRGAQPGENMMAVRRYLTSLYDWTGFSRLFYTSHWFEILSVLVVGVITGALLWVFKGAHPDMVHARLNSVWPAPGMEIADLIMAGVLSFLLLSNTVRCATFILGDYRSKIPLPLYVREARDLVIQFFTPRIFKECSDRMQWYVHLLIMTGYSSVFLLVVVFLAGGLHFLGLYRESFMFQRDVIYPLWHPVRLVGYYATVALFYGVTYAMIGRLKKSKAPYRFSHTTDWMFLILLQLTTFTGILIHIGRLLDVPMAVYVIYAVHLMICIPMLVLEVPFAKWSHLAYRPVTSFLTRVIAAYKGLEAASK